MDKYIEYYFELLINTRDINEIKSVLPSINLDKTNYILDILISKLLEEIELAKEFDDQEYLEHCNVLVTLLKASKIEEIEETSIFETENIIIFSDGFLKSLRKLNDSLFYGECLTTVEALMSKQWMENNKFNDEKYKRLHGEAYGLSEVKTKNVRLLHMPINPDFWYVCDVIKKEGDTSKQYRLFLNSLTASSKEEVEFIRKQFTVDGQLDYAALMEFARVNNEQVMEELQRFGGRKR